jgi:ferredoxin
VHTERFSAADLEPGRPFSVRLSDGSGVRVPSGVSLLEALESKGFRIPNRCRQGVCGECRLDVVSGTPEHRDLYLSEAERATGDSLMSCVSRSHDELELTL